MSGPVAEARALLAATRWALPLRYDELTHEVTDAEGERVAVMAWADGAAFLIAAPRLLAALADEAAALRERAERLAALEGAHCPGCEPPGCPGISAIDVAPAAPGEHPVATAERARCVAVCRVVESEWLALESSSGERAAEGARMCAEPLERLSPAERG